MADRKNPDININDIFKNPNEARDKKIDRLFADNSDDVINAFKTLLHKDDNKNR